MPRKTAPLTDTQIKASKPKDKDYSLFDGGGMYLLVKSNGSKIWRFKYRRPYTKKSALISFGHYPEISLQQARKSRDESRELIKKNIDPQENKLRELRLKIGESNNTFKNVSLKWFKIEKTKGYTVGTLTKKWASLENHVFPYVGNLPISTITPYLVINSLQPLKNPGTLSTVKRIFQRIKQIEITNA